MWADILLMNQPALDEALARAAEGLETLRRLLADGDAGGVLAYLETARDFRRGIER